MVLVAKGLYGSGTVSGATSVVESVLVHLCDLDCEAARFGVGLSWPYPELPSCMRLQACNICTLRVIGGCKREQK